MLREELLEELLTVKSNFELDKVIEVKTKLHEHRKNEGNDAHINDALRITSNV